MFRNTIITLLFFILFATMINAEWSIDNECILGTDLGIDNFRHISFYDDLSIGIGVNPVDLLIISIYQQILINESGSSHALETSLVISL